MRLNTKLMNIEEKEIQYLPVIVREYNLILKKKSKLPRAKRDFMVALAEQLVKKGKLAKLVGGEVSFEIKLD